ncbi:hypothetical protein WJX77_000219 [Trebouxia sp. C0004]
MTVDTKQPEVSVQPGVLEDSEAQASSPVTSAEYTSPGPFRVARLPRLEHTCHKLFPQCLGTQCLLRRPATLSCCSVHWWFPGQQQQLSFIC